MECTEEDQLKDRVALALIPTLVYLGILMAVGLVGNSLVLLVYYRRFKPSTTRTFILAISVSGLATNILSLPGEIYDVRFSYTLDNPDLCRLMRFSNSFLTLVTAFILVPMALDRYRKICRPLHKQHSLRRTTVSIVVCAGVSVALTIPFTVLNGRQTVDTGVGNITGVTCSVDDDFVNTMFPVLHSLSMAVAFVISVTIIIASYVCIARELWRHRKKSTVSGTGSQRTRVNGDGEVGPGGPREESFTNEDSTSDAKEEAASTEFQPSSCNADRVTVVSNAVNNAPNANVGNVQSRADTVVLLSPPASNDEPVINSSEHADISCVSVPTPSDFSDMDVSDAEEHFTQPPACDPAHVSVATVAQTGCHNSADNIKEQKTASLLLPARPKSQSNVTAKCLQSSIFTKSARKRRRAGKKIPKSTTFMMFVLSTIFIINYLPHLIIISARAALGDITKGLTGFGLNAYHIALRSYFINCAVNSIVYGFCSARFRQECRRFFSRG